jgi:SAM-dependent methyltransferase
LRWLVTSKFNSSILPLLPAIQKVALVGGGPNEAELEIINLAGGISVTFFGIEEIPNDEFRFLDLNADSEFEEEFDLVICSQVLEHVWNHQLVFDNLAKLVKVGGLLWIGCPASNYAHGSPGYYAAGFAPEYLEKNFHLRNFSTILSEFLGSSRYYFLTHALQIWGGKRLHAFPLFFGVSRYYPKEFLGRLFALTRSTAIRNDSKFATETVALFQKN